MIKNLIGKVMAVSAPSFFGMGLCVLLCLCSLKAVAQDSFGGTALGLKMMELNFDEEFYIKTYPEVRVQIATGIYNSGFHHYIFVGAKKKFSPRASFDENKYLSRYADVRTLVTSSKVLSGYEHWVTVGRYRGYVAEASVAVPDNGVNQRVANMVAELSNASLQYLGRRPNDQDVQSSITRYLSGTTTAAMKAEIINSWEAKLRNSQLGKIISIINSLLLDD